MAETDIRVAFLLAVKEYQEVCDRLRAVMIRKARIQQAIDALEKLTGVTSNG